MDLAEADACTATLVALEQRITDGEPVSIVERAATHAAYQAAERWRSEQETQARRDQMEQQGIVPGPTQGVTIGA